jgi:hypothetical protein
LPWRAPFAHGPLARSRKLATWDDILPKRVANAHDDRVVLGEVVDARDSGGLIELVVGCLGGLRRWKFSHALHVGGRACLACARGDFVCELFDVSVGGVEHLYLGIAATPTFVVRGP